MKVLLLSQFFSATRGGGEYVFELLAKKLAENGNKVWVVTNRIDGEKYESNSGVNLVFVEPTLQYKGGMPSGLAENIRYVTNAVKTGRKLVKKHQIDLIHSNNFAPALAGSLLSYITCKPHITTIHDVFSLCGRNYWKRWGAQSGVSKMSVALAPLFERLSVRLRSDCIHTVSEASREDIEKLGVKKPVYVIHNSIGMKQQTRHETDPQQFVAVGRLVFYKNLEIVIDAIRIARATNPKIKLIIIGDGPHRQKLEDKVKSLGLEASVRFAGHISDQEKTRIIAESAAMLFPSICEGFGLVILEAFLHGKPVLVSDVRPQSDIVQNEHTGYVIDPHDSQSWADKVIECTKDIQKRTEMGTNGRKILESSYSQESMYEKIMQMYQSFI